jgi:DNA-directed RNA polymerase specialized sigma24 family protein
MTTLTGTTTSAEAFVDVVAVYIDRIHDDARRLGATKGEAVEVVETSALDLLERVRFRPQEVADVTGEWFRSARTLAERVVDGREPPPAADLPADAPRGLLAAAEDDRRTREALAKLSDADRLTLLLRDGADLPEPTVAVALGVAPERVPPLVAHARLALDGIDDAAAAHLEELGRLTRQVDGTLPADQRRSVSSHVGRCPACKSAQPRLSDARARLRSLSIVAMPDIEREAVIGRVTTLARKHLPTAAQLAGGQRVVGGARGPRLGIVAATLAGALVLGTLTGLASGDNDGSGLASGVHIPTTIDRSPEESESPSPSPSPSASASRSPSPSASATSASPSAAATSALPSESVSSSASVAPTHGTASITLSPTSGRQCTKVTVTGRNWAPGTTVRVSYRDVTGNQVMRQTTATPGADGRFTATLQACDARALPGPHRVLASSGAQSDTATFTQTA